MPYHAKSHSVQVTVHVRKTLKAKSAGTPRFLLKPRSAFQFFPAGRKAMRVRHHPDSPMKKGPRVRPGGIGLCTRIAELGVDLGTKIT